MTNIQLIGNGFLLILLFSWFTACNPSEPQVVDTLESQILGIWEQNTPDVLIDTSTIESITYFEFLETGEVLVEDSAIPFAAIFARPSVSTQWYADEDLMRINFINVHDQFGYPDTLLQGTYYWDVLYIDDSTLNVKVFDVYNDEVFSEFTSLKRKK